MTDKLNLPNGWRWEKFGDIVHNLDGKRKPLSKEVRSKRNGQYRYYGATEIVDYIDDYLFEGEHLLIGEDGANLLSKSKALAFIVDGKFWVNNHAHVLQAKETSVNKYLCYYFNSLNLSKFVTGTAQPKLTQGNLNKIEIPICPFHIQKKIVSKIEELFSELDKGIENLRTAQQQLKTYRQAVLKWAFEGRLTNENVKDGELPKGWKNVSITELVEKNKHALKAGPFGSSLKKEFYVPKGYKIYGQEQVISGDAFYGDYFVSEEKYQELTSCKIKPFDILIRLVGTVGKVLLLPENCHNGIINPRLVKISLARNVYLPKFFKYYFESSFVKSFYGAETRGTTMDVLNLGIIKTIPFPLCTIEEQNKIIQEIESRFSVADKMEESIIQSLQQAEGLRQSILKKAFEGKLI